MAALCEGERLRFASLYRFRNDLIESSVISPPMPIVTSLVNEARTMARSAGSASSERSLSTRTSWNPLPSASSARSSENSEWPKVWRRMSRNLPSAVVTSCGAKMYICALSGVNFFSAAA